MCTLSFFCLIAYNETKTLDGSNVNEIRESIEKIINERCNIAVRFR